ncbi:MAG: hypothetical protein V2A73_01190 [Pseudomonadota bacterium]
MSDTLVDYGHYGDTAFRTVRIGAQWWLLREDLDPPYGVTIERVNDDGTQDASIPLPAIGVAAGTSRMSVSGRLRYHVGRRWRRTHCEDRHIGTWRQSPGYGANSASFSSENARHGRRT